MKQIYIRPFGKPIREPLWKRVARWLLIAVGSLLLGLIMLVVLLEWMVGCGETYVDAKGVRHQYSCLFIPQPKGDTK